MLSKSKTLMVFLIVSVLAFMPIEAATAPKQNPLLNGAYRVDKDGWIYAHLEGTPHQIGYQNGWLLWDNINASISASIWFYWSSDYSSRETFGDAWYIARGISRIYIWPKLTGEMKAEIQGIADGVKARGLKWDKWDILAAQAWSDIGVYWDLYMSKDRSGVVGRGKYKDREFGPSLSARCSAFIATGSYTEGGEIVIAHNTWTDYGPGECLNVIVDINPTKGHRMIMQSTGGTIWSGPDWIYNDAGLMLTETTMPGMGTYDPTGIPVFVRERLAMQYGSSIDDFLHTMLYRNNGAYSNDWLVGDAKTGEICSLQLGCEVYDLYRSFDDMIVSSNYPKGPNIRTETSFDYNDPNTVPYWRYSRWLEIRDYYTANKGLIDCELAMEFESDHKDMYSGLTEATIRTLCGHGEVYTPGPVTNWDGSELEVPYLVGALDGKVTCSSLVQNDMGMWGRFGHPCGEVFHAAEFIDDNPEFAWQLPYLHDMPDSGGDPVPWSYFPA